MELSPCTCARPDQWRNCCWLKVANAKNAALTEQLATAVLYLEALPAGKNSVNTDAINALVRDGKILVGDTNVENIKTNAEKSAAEVAAAKEKLAAEIDKQTEIGKAKAAVEAALNTLGAAKKKYAGTYDRTQEMLARLEAEAQAASEDYTTAQAALDELTNGPPPENGGDENGGG